MPAQGKLIGEFSESANRKGIDIAGTLGQPVVASAPGKVVYSGSGLRGYGKLIIIKHNKTYLSAYAHNDQILVKEGQSVTQADRRSPRWATPIPTRSNCISRCAVSASRWTRPNICRW